MSASYFSSEFLPVITSLCEEARFLVVWIPWFLLCPPCYSVTWEPEPGRREQETHPEMLVLGKDPDLWIMKCGLLANFLR